MSANNGITGGLETTTLPIAMTLSAFTAIAWYNVLELNFMIWMTFKRRHGLYFYSLLVSSWGIFVYALAFLMKFFQVSQNNYVTVVFITIGWYAMVTGQSLVLYSRLHLVMHDQRVLKWVLWMIIVDVFLFHVPTTVMTFGANSTPGDNKFATPYSIMEKIQITAFCTQEFIISGLYVYATHQLPKPGETFKFGKRRTRQVMLHLIYVNLVVILMDIALLCMQYANLYEIQITFKGALYSIKLRLEFTVLNQLRSLVLPDVDGYGNPTCGNCNFSNAGEREDKGKSNYGEQLQNIETQLKSYTCEVGGRSKGRFSREVEGNCVVLTREVKVESETTSQQDNFWREVKESIGSTSKADEVLGMNVGNDKMSRRKRGQSPTESEVEFAARGS